MSRLHHLHKALCTFRDDRQPNAFPQFIHVCRGVPCLPSTWLFRLSLVENTLQQTSQTNLLLSSSLASGFDVHILRWRCREEWPWNFFSQNEHSTNVTFSCWAQWNLNCTVWLKPLWHTVHVYLNFCSWFIRCNDSPYLVLNSFPQCSQISKSDAVSDGGHPGLFWCTLAWRFKFDLLFVL
jgi:hypothetical protein